MSTPNGRKITVIHACQWSLCRAGLSSALGGRTNIELIAHATNGKDLIDLLDHKSPDIVFLDISLPIMDGMEALRVIKTKFPLMRVIMLTMHNDALIILKALELGASGYLTMEAGANEICEAIQHSFRPGVYLNKGAKRSLTPLSFPLDSLFESIKTKEVNVIRLLSDNKNQETIAREFDLSVRTIQAIIDRLMKIARVSSTKELVNKARLIGLIE
jgi:DNA-binding NarL/FixJ family response regulator